MSENNKEKKITPQERYHKKFRKDKLIPFFTHTEADLLAKIESEPNQSGYIKRLIREDIEKEKLKKN
ncbi:MAG: hypothetical protein LBP62_05640 [Clostridiales bacterium]|jgi:hypothetical protein|nr:hypothetical protein [Clostridiales bacterium]